MTGHDAEKRPKPRIDRPPTTSGLSDKPSLIQLSFEIDPNRRGHAGGPKCLSA